MGPPARTWRGDALRQRFLQTANKGIFKRRKDLIHLRLPVEYAARRQNAVIKALTGHLRWVFSTAASRWRSLISYW